jgi:hypothetical protein
MRNEVILMLWQILCKHPVSGDDDVTIILEGEKNEDLLHEAKKYAESQTEEWQSAYGFMKLTDEIAYYLQERGYELIVPRFSHLEF